MIKVAPHTDGELIDWNRDLKKKYEHMSASEQRSELLHSVDAEAAVVAFGSTARIALDAVVRARAEGMGVALFRPISLFPFPNQALQTMVASGVRRLLVLEANNGQMVEDVRAAAGDSVNIAHYGFGGGHVFTPDEIYRKLIDWSGRSPETAAIPSGKGKRSQ